MLIIYYYYYYHLPKCCSRFTVTVSMFMFEIAIMIMIMMIIMIIHSLWFSHSLCDYDYHISFNFMYLQIHHYD